MQIISKKDSLQVAKWLIVGCSLVAIMVLVGGITRLTNSGLSMVTWKPVTGIIPPLNEMQWHEEFNKYKTSPEYIKKNYHFTLKEFKNIFFWEYLHRLIGRIMGIVFLIPFVYFILKGKIKQKWLLRNTIIMFLLGGLQGLAGWYMVKSGLVDNPNVSHFRLAIHFILALFLFAFIFWNVLLLIFPKVDVTLKNTKKTFLLAKILLFFTTIQFIYGAFVAGLKAGKIYPTFPKMGTEWFPNIISENFKEHSWFSLINDHYTIQFIHRWMAVIVLVLTIYLFFYARRQFLSLYQKRAINSLIIIIGFQFVLGVFTILYSAPVILGVLHQFGGFMFLMSILLVLYFFKNKKTENFIA